MIFSILHRMMQHDDGVVQNDYGNQHVSFLTVLLCMHIITVLVCNIKLSILFKHSG